ncbi:lipopolysaccharide transport system ATP-binding protein [Mariprofundus ferrinatatus]|uniref:Lipopolysaccharide transport system ATP-binding protein n=2 Tax=Mariprofundus ferrinatatus TaxID=1921087 RepID=A0A2K8L279_9PROT|nr:lipopolysaccharide transport system ATP-binding protein [Mariprofundus ferrinatatus]
MRVCNIGVCYKQKRGFMRSSEYWALKNVSFDIFHGETLGVIGRNGVGKSSLLKVLAGVIKPDRGHIETMVDSVALLGLQVGFKQTLSGRDNAIMNGMMQGVSRTVMEEKLTEIIGFTELEGFIDQPVCNYSAGMRARLRFAIAIQSDPDVLLIDEALGVGDAGFRKKSAEVIKSRIASDQTVLIVSHDMDTLRGLCQRILWVDQGETRMIGPVDEVLYQYESSGR